MSLKTDHLSNRFSPLRRIVGWGDLHGYMISSRQFARSSAFGFRPALRELSGKGDLVRDDRNRGTVIGRRSNNSQRYPGSRLAHSSVSLIDTIHFACHRPLKAEIYTALKKDGVYNGKTWQISTTRSLEKNGDCVQQTWRVRHKDKSMTKVLRASGKGENLEAVKVQLPCMLRPGNGFMLLSNEDLRQAMENTFREFDCIAERGLDWKDTSRLDVVMNLKVCPTEVLNIMKSVRVLGLHGWPNTFEDLARANLLRSDPQTVQWHDSRRSELWLSFYNKPRMEAEKSRSKGPIEGCLRIEYRMLKKKRIAKFLGSSAGGAMVNFDYLSLYRSLRAVLCTLPAASTVKDPCNFDTLLADCSAKGILKDGLPVMDWYRSTVGERQFAKKAKAIASLAMKTIGLDWKDILPKHSPPEMVHVDGTGRMFPAFHDTWGARKKIVRSENQYVLVDV